MRKPAAITVVDLPRLVAAALTAVALLVGDSESCAQTTTEPEQIESQAPEEKPIKPALDLGSFKVNDLRPAHNETAKLTFSLHLQFSEETTAAQLKKLEGWKHRLRDQVITAVRLAETKDFQEPDLKRLRRLILIRVNRLFRTKLAEEVLLTEYLFRTY